MSEVLVSVDSISKKFCRSLKRSLWYGAQDMVHELLGCRSESDLRFDEFWAVKDVSFTLKRGECLGLIGRNGAGKTTLLRMLNGLIKPDQGKIEIRGRIGALISLGAGFNPVLSGRENVYVNGSILGLSKREIDKKIDEIVDFAEISDFIDSPLQNYSSGMQMRLGFAIATALEPDILLLDEILAVGDAAFRTKCFNRIESLISKCAVIFVSHSMPQVTRVCDKLLLMKNGVTLEYGNNLGDIIFAYYASTDSKVTSASAEGNQQGKIESVQIYNSQGEATNSLNYGESWKISATIFLEEATVPLDVKFMVTINDQEEINVAQLEKMIGAPQLTGKFNIIMEFDQCLLNSGKYFLTANLQVGIKGVQAHVIRNVMELMVNRNITAYAPVIFNSKKTLIMPFSEIK